jgi:L-ascorbate metabolism protein UlaG (beta-lactamase superfamily)
MGLDRDTTITWYGHACLEVVTPGGKTILFDPWFSNPKSPKAVTEVERCDLLLLTHGHFDHMAPGGADVLQVASRLSPVWPCIHEMSLWAGRLIPGGMDAVIGMNKGGTVEAAGIKVAMVHADHSAGDWNAEGGTTLYLGEPVGFVVELENGFRIYQAGDTAVFGDMRLIAERWHPDLAILPIGGHFTMDPVDAALAVEFLGVKQVLPVHYGTFPILAGRPAHLRDELAKRGLGDVVVYEIEPGESLS